MWIAANCAGVTPEERRQAIAKLLAKGVMRLGSDPDLAASENTLNPAKAALQSRAPDPFMSTVVNAPQSPRE
jgi:hypothetical protein